MTEFYNELGSHLEKLRGKMSLREASIKSGLSHTYIRDLELGMNRKTKAPINPTPETLKRLAEAYDAPYEELMEMAGYIEDSNPERLLDKALLDILKMIDMSELDRRFNNGDPIFTNNIPSWEEFLSVLGLKDKLEMLMIFMEEYKNLKQLVNEKGDKEWVFANELAFDLDDDILAKTLKLSYKGMELTEAEKIEFLSIARAIFSARRGLKEKD